mgnify:FL=1
MLNNYEDENMVVFWCDCSLNYCEHSFAMKMELGKRIESLTGNLESSARLSSHRLEVKL